MVARHHVRSTSCGAHAGPGEGLDDRTDLVEHPTVDEFLADIRKVVVEVIKHGAVDDDATVGDRLDGLSDQEWADAILKAARKRSDVEFIVV